jgi:hypothetical protein
LPKPAEHGVAQAGQADGPQRVKERNEALNTASLGLAKPTGG